MQKIKTSVVTSVIALCALVLYSNVYAAGATTQLNKLIISLIKVANNVVVLLIIISVIVFIWGIIRVVFSVEEAKRKEGRKYLIYGVIAFAVMSGLWGLSNFLLAFFDINTSAEFNVPQIGTGDSAGTGGSGGAAGAEYDGVDPFQDLQTPGVYDGEEVPI